MKKFNDFKLFEESLSNVKDVNTIKILVQVPNGLGDAIGTLEGVLMFANKYGFEPKQIFWKAPKEYPNLNEYINFKEINFIDFTHPVNIDEFTHVITRSGNNYLLSTKNLKFKLHDYLTFSSLIEKESNKYARDIGLHIRVKEYENGKKLNSVDLANSIDNAYNLIIKRFNSIYDQKKEYFASTDSPLLNEYLTNYNNVVYIPKLNYVYDFLTKGCSASYSSALDLAILSKCKEIYGLGSTSGYPHLARSLSKHETISYIQIHVKQ